MPSDIVARMTGLIQASNSPSGEAPVAGWCKF